MKNDWFFVKSDNLKHYASPYYDPQKAHEYYMNHRKLKGRSTASLDDEGKEIWSYTKEQIKNEKKEKVSEQKEFTEKIISDARSKADQTRIRITNKLKKLNEMLSNKSSRIKERVKDDKNRAIEQISSRNKSDKEKISSSLERRIKSVQNEKIPAAEKKEKIAKLRGEAQVERESINAESNANKKAIQNEANDRKNKVSEAYKTERNNASNSAKNQRETCATELKNVITAARNAYKQMKTSINNEYEAVYQAEYDKIMEEHSKKGGKYSK